MNWMLLIVIIVATAGCSALKVEGGCTYTRSLVTTYQCPDDGRLEHNRLAPWNPEL